MSKGRIVVGGILFTFPLGGVLWQHLHYLLGLRRLGYEVTYVEVNEYYPNDYEGDGGFPDVERVCKHVVVLRDGQVATEGDVKEIRRLEAGTWRVRVLGDRDVFASALRERGADVREDDGEILVAKLVPGADARVIFSAATASRCVVRELSSFEHSLEGAFLRAVAEAG